MAEPITQARLRALSAVHPDQGRVLSVFLNLDPSAVRHARGTIVRDHLGDDRRGAQGRRERRAHARRAHGVARRRRARARACWWARTSPPNGTRAVAVYACGAEDLLEVVRLRRPGREQGRARPHGVRRAARDAGHRRALDGAADQPPLRAAVLRPGRRARGDRPARRRRPPAARARAAGRSPTTSARWTRRSPTTSRTPPTSRSTLYKKRGADRVLVGVPAELHARVQGQAAPVPDRARRRARSPSTSRTRRSTTCARPRGRRSRPTSCAASARRWTGCRRASAAAAAARRASPRCWTRSTRRAWRRC